MGLSTSDPQPSANGTPDAGQELPELHTRKLGDKPRAVADLLQDKQLTHTFGFQGEWEVRTTLITGRQAWRYRSSVLLHGKEMRDNYSPIDIDWTHKIRQAKAVTEEMLAEFAREAVELHFHRCADVADYSLMASIYAQSLPRHSWMKKAALVLLCVAALFTTYWFWGGGKDVGLEQAEQKPPPPSLRWQSLQVSHRYPAGETFVLPLPTLEHTPAGMAVDVTLEGSADRPDWLQLDRERHHIRGTAPFMIEDQTYRFIVRARAKQGSDSRLLVLLTITGQPDRPAPTPKLPGHWAW
jgi:hypothetical protein